MNESKNTEIGPMISAKRILYKNTPTVVNFKVPISCKTSENQITGVYSTPLTKCYFKSENDNLFNK